MLREDNKTYGLYWPVNYQSKFHESFICFVIYNAYLKQFLRTIENYL